MKTICPRARRLIGTACLLAMTSLVAIPSALACGDKLVALGGGVRFERIVQSRYPGKVVVFASANSKFGQTETALRLGKSLSDAGHAVQVVRNRAELEHALQGGSPDLVIMDWSDARDLGAEFGSGSLAPPILSVLHSPSDAELAAARQQRNCVAQVSKRGGRNVIRTVEEILAGRGKGIPALCNEARTTRT